MHTKTIHWNGYEYFNCHAFVSKNKKNNTLWNVYIAMEYRFFNRFYYNRYLIF